LKKDKTQLILISGNYTAKEIFEREWEIWTKKKE
jgi:hypothetical protein